MKINFNGTVREMTEDELAVLKKEELLFHDDNIDNDIPQRIEKLEEEMTNKADEIEIIFKALCEVYEAAIE